MDDLITSDIIELEKRLANWLKQQPDDLGSMLIALGISCARLIYGAGTLLGEESQDKAARLLSISITNALEVLHREAVEDSRTLN